MPRKKMKAFNVCNNFDTRINNLIVPKGAFYGRRTLNLLRETHKDTWWVIRDKNVYHGTTKKGARYYYINMLYWDKTLNMWRSVQLRDNISGAWCGEILQFVADHVYDWMIDIPIEYPKYAGIHDLFDDSVRYAQSLRKHKSKTIKQMSKHEAENRLKDNNMKFFLSTFRCAKEESRPSNPMNYTDWLIAQGTR